MKLKDVIDAGIGSILKATPAGDGMGVSDLVEARQRLADLCVAAEDVERKGKGDRIILMGRVGEIDRQIAEAWTPYHALKVKIEAAEQRIGMVGEWQAAVRKAREIAAEFRASAPTGCVSVVGHPKREIVAVVIRLSPSATIGICTFIHSVKHMGGALGTVSDNPLRYHDGYARRTPEGHWRFGEDTGLFYEVDEE